METSINRVGDQIISANGKTFAPVESFTVPEGKAVHVKVKRSLKSNPITLSVQPKFESFQRTMLTASVTSYSVKKVRGKKIGYFHLWAGTNDESMQALADMAKKAARETDALVLDLRDGFGGAYPDYLNPFYDHDPRGRSIPQV